jgi:hypothetical protein
VSSSCSQEDEVSKTSSHQQTLKSNEESRSKKRGVDAVSSSCSQEDEVSKTSSHQQTLKSNEGSGSKKIGVDAVSSSCSQEDEVSKTSSHQQTLKSATEYVDCKGSSIEKVSLVNKGEQASHKGMESANPELRKPPAVDDCVITDEVANQSQVDYEAKNPEAEKPLAVQADYRQLTKAEEKSAVEREPEESVSKAASSSAGIEKSPQNPMVVDDMIVDQEDNIAKSDDREHPPQSRGDGVEVKTNGKSAVEKETEQSEIKSIEVKEPEKAFPESPPPASIRKTGRPLPLSKDIADEQMHDGALKPVKDGKLNSQAASLVTASDSKSDDVAYGKIAETINAAIAATPRPHKEDPAKKKQKRSRSETPKDQAKKKQKKAPKEKAKKKQKTPHSEAPQDGSKYVSKHRQRYAPKTGSGTWTDQEEFFFRKGILICGVGKWKRVVKYVPSRSYNQIIGHAQIFKINYVDEWNEIKAIAEDLNMPFDEKMEWLTSKEEYKQFANQSEMEMPEEIKNSHSPAPADDDDSENTANHTNSPAASEPNVSNSGEDLPGVFNSSDLLNARLAQNVVFAQNAANANKLMLGGLDRPLLGLGGGLGGMPPSLLAGGGLGGLPALSSLGLSGSREELQQIANQSVMDKLEEKRKSSLPAYGHNSQNVANHTNPPAASESNVSILGEDLPGVFNASDLLNARLAQNAAFARNAANANSLLSGSTSGMLGGWDRPLIGLGGGLGGMPPSLLAGGWLGGLPARPSLGLGGDSLLGMHNHDLFDGSGRDMLNMSLVEIEQSAQRCLESIAQQQDLLSRLGRAKRIKVMSAMLEQNHGSL